MTDPDLVDRLAEWCRLSERGYTRDDDGSWVPDRPGLDRVAWHPLESDDDCRVVLERFYEVATKKQKILFYEALVTLDDLYGLYAVIEAALLATPAEKCAAVLKVMGDDA